MAFELSSISQRDILLANKWTSLFFTTFSLSLSLVEAAALSAVQRSYRDCTILTDVEGYRQSLADAGAVGVGRHYDVVPVGVRGGVFHPKVAVFADGDGNVRAAVGSGNLTFGGWGYNSELLDVLLPGRDSTCFRELAEFIEFLNTPSARQGRLSIEGDAKLDQYASACRKAAGVAGADASRFLHTLELPLDRQIADLAAEQGGASSLTVVSPFFSAHRGVARLARALACENVSVAVTPVAPANFDFEAARQAGLAVSPVASDAFMDERPLHAKLFDIQCRRGRIVVTGSANATDAAMQRNVEAVVARVVDRNRTFGWKPSGVHVGRVTDDPLPEESSGHCAIARIEGGLVVGKILGVAGASGEWQGFLSAGVAREAAGTVVVDGEGRFRFEAPASMIPLLQSTSMQAILERPGMEVRGWLILQDLLKAFREKGPIAHAVARMLSGTDTSADVDALLEYFAKAPGEFLDAAARQGGGRRDRNGATPRNEIVPAGELQPRSAFDNAGTWSSGASGRSFGSMIEALIRRFASSLAGGRDDDANADDDEEEDEGSGGRSRGGGTASARRREGVRTASVERAFTAMIGMLKSMPAGPGRAPGLFLLFDMIIQILPRCDDGDHLTPSYLREWLNAAEGCRAAEGAFDALDRCVAAVLTKEVMDDPMAASRAHSVLQRWLGAPVDEAAAASLEPDLSNLDVSRLAPAALQEGWSEAWRAMISSETPWMVALAIQSSLSAGRQPEPPAGATNEEASMLRRVASGEVAKDRVLFMTARRSGHQACPRCSIQLPRDQENRLKSRRIATCRGFRCGRVIVDVAP